MLPKVKDISTQLFKSDTWIDLKGFESVLKEICADNDIEITDSTQFIRKFGVTSKAEIDEKERTVTRLVSTPHVDRDLDIIDPAGIVMNDFKKNPVVLWAHNHFALPIGKDLWIKQTKDGIIAKTQFASAEANPQAEQVFQLIKEGMLNTSSIGFIPVEMLRAGSKEFDEKLKEISERSGISKSKLKTAERIFTKVILLEHSDVPVPANPNALNLAVSKGLSIDSVKADIEGWIEEESEEEVLRERIKELETENSELIEQLSKAILIEPEISAEPGIIIEATPKISLPALPDAEPAIDIKQVGDMLSDILNNYTQNVKDAVSKKINIEIATKQGRIIE